jgi:hypothetical protein
MYKAAQGIEAYVYEDKIEDADAGARQLCTMHVLTLGLE